MTPLICFYENEQFIHCENYEILECPVEQSLTDFLRMIEKKYFSKLKILQVNFEAQNEEIFQHQKSLYPSAKAQVFILNDFELAPLAQIRENVSTTEIEFTPLITSSEFIYKTRLIQKDIQEGRIYQVNLTSPLVATTSLNSKNLFWYFEKKFKGLYKAYLPFNDFEIFSYSPELFLQQKSNVLKTRPIKGSASVEKEFSANLYKNEKEAAELSMIVDLLRNDLNSLSSDHASAVTAHREALQLGYIQHTYSEITVKNLLPLSDVLAKTFPGGSISGCPKKESLQVIAELEPYKRQAYTGAIGWWQQNDFTLNLTIRSFVKHQNQLFYFAGCGIVFDSNPEAEWEEFLLKTGKLNVKLKN